MERARLDRLRPSPRRLREIRARRHERHIMENVFAELLSARSDDDRYAAYIIREHRGGRCLDDILEDGYLTNHLSGLRRQRLLERPDLLHSIADDFARAARDVHRANGR